MLLCGGGGGVSTTYSENLIKGFGYMTKHSALLNVGSGTAAIACCLLTSHGVRRFGNRWFFSILTAIPAIIGGDMMAYLPKTRKTALLAGSLGATKRSCATALLNAASKAVAGLTVK
jgi:hypothetical protein